MSNHNYTNPAFCQQSELQPSAFYQSASRSTFNSPAKIHRSELTRSFNRISSSITRQNSFACHGPERANNRVLPPTAGSGIADQYVSHTSVAGARYASISSALDTSISSKKSSGRYALVPVEEIAANDKGRYAILPIEHNAISVPSARIVKSQEHLDRYSSISNLDDEPANLSDQFCSLPPLSSPIPPVTQNRLKNAFSSDFGSKSFILYDQKSNQRYEVVPTEEDEELVDPNHEIIQMHNGRAHRYAVIPTEDDETCLDEEQSIKNDPQSPCQKVATRENINRSQPSIIPQRTPSTRTVSTPKKNPLATQMLHELLSTPKREEFTPKNSPIRHDINPKIVSSTPKRNEFKPQKLQYDYQMQQSSYPTQRTTRAEHSTQKQKQLLEAAARTTAVITPRLNVVNGTSVYGETTSSDHMSKSWQNTSFQKIAHASATIGSVSLMLILCGFMNSGLSLYFTSKVGREYYLDLAIFAGFAAIALGILGFKSRHCDWLPNRNYISGYILVTVFSLLNCCAQLALMTLHPFPGSPLHDVTTGIILGLSSLTILLISLGIVTSRLCRAPPPDNRVDVC
ncbi:uncharacterized protein LOC129780196 [Toxorhynchites rutilus septentrionalis]|uniref:uncharacterized protein LOC129780196 n=1 Tax=Toxorhynchites rutilus septentrionalis TaxID=329112 RepID=UPI0024783755|nr:uncharacterized protein LOC129780196 [Toxorhynchites rutilus septentrionalis]